MRKLFSLLLGLFGYRHSSKSVAAQEDGFCLDLVEDPDLK